MASRRLETLAVAGLTACLLSVASLEKASAAVYHVLDLGEAAGASYANFLGQDSIADAPGGKAATIDKVSLDFANGGAATLDETHVVFDCKVKRFKVMAERVFQGIAADSPGADKTNSADWQSFAAGSPMDNFQTLACTGAAKQEVVAFERSSVWTAATTVSGALTKIHNDETGGK